jgi:virginiamycin A acetyltransferase
MSERRPVGVLVDRVAAAHASYHVGRYRVLARLGVATFQQASEAVGQVPLFYGYRVRQSFYGRLLQQCGDHLEMNVGATVSEPRSHIGHRVWVGPGCFLDFVDIGDDAMLGPHVVVLAAGGNTHRFDTSGPVRNQGNNPLVPTRIGAGAWIGANAVVMADVGEGAVVGAGAVVTEAVAPRLIVAGNPARQIGQRPAVA